MNGVLLHHVEELAAHSARHILYFADDFGQRFVVGLDRASEGVDRRGVVGYDFLLLSHQPSRGLHKLFPSFLVDFPVELPDFVQEDALV